MAFADHIRSTFREFQQGLDRMAERAFGSPADEVARGEFISDFISERGLGSPATRRDRPQR